MKDEQKYLSPEQVTEAYCKALIAENHTLKQQNTLLTEVNEAQAFTIDKYKQQNEEMKTMLKEAKEIALLQADLAKGNMQYKSMERMQVLSSRITDLLTKHKL